MNAPNFSSCLSHLHPLKRIYGLLYNPPQPLETQKSEPYGAMKNPNLSSNISYLNPPPPQSEQRHSCTCHTTSSPDSTDSCPDHYPGLPNDIMNAPNFSSYISHLHPPTLLERRNGLLHLPQQCERSRHFIIHQPSTPPHPLKAKKSKPYRGMKAPNTS